MASLREWVWVLLIGALILAVAFPAAARAGDIAVRQVLVCDGSGAGGDACRSLPVHELDPQGRLLRVSAPVRLDASQSEQPLGVFVSALAASTVYWDGRQIGRNGRPAADPQVERPGYRDSVFAIPQEASGPGVHTLSIVLSTGQLPWRVVAPVQSIRIGAYAQPRDILLRKYLPALMTAGGLLVACVYFGAMFLFGRGLTTGPHLVGAALFAMAQLCVEASRAFLPYLYTDHILRLGLILACAEGFGLMLLAYAVQRFVPERRSLLLATQVGLAALIAAAVPGFDQKTSLVLFASALLAAIAALLGMLRSKPGARPVLAVLAGCLVATVVSPDVFLDRDLYLWLTVLFLVLFVEQGLEMRRQRLGRLEAEEQSVFWRRKLNEASRPDRLALGSEKSRRLVRPADILRLMAADDYTEVFLTSGRSVLHPEPLHKLIARLPSTFVRVHRSHAVNLEHVDAYRGSGESVVVLTDQASVPVSRRRRVALAEALASSG